MNVKRFFGILIFMFGLVFALSTIKLIDSEISCAICIPVCSLGIYLFVFSFEWSKHKATYYSRMPHISKEHLIKEEMSEGLNQYLDSLLKIFFNSDCTERIILYKKDNDVLINKEKLYFFNEEEFQFTKKYAIWEPVDLGISFYDSLETAVKENQYILKGFYEERIDFFYLNNNRRHIVEVIWKTNNIIYSTKFRPQIRIKNSNPRDVSLINIKEIDDKKTKAILYYIIPNNVNKDDTLTIGTCFELYDGPCFIGTGTVIEYWEER